MRPARVSTSTMASMLTSGAVSPVTRRISASARRCEMLRRIGRVRGVGGLHLVEHLLQGGDADGVEAAVEVADAAEGAW